MNSNRFPHALLGAALVAASLSAQAGPFTGLYVFGDSLSDTGNNKFYLGTAGSNPPTATWVPPAGPYDSGYYSNGPVWANAFASGIGLLSYAGPSLLGGGNFAHGGAKVSADGAAPAPLPSNFPPSLKTQLNTYLGVGPNPVSSTALYVVAGGGNDVRKTGDLVVADPLNATAIITNAATTYATDVATMVGTLKLGGAQNVVVWNVPDLGRTPAALAGGPVVSGTATAISNAFNGALSFALGAQTGVTLFDTFGIITTIATTGSYNGFNFGETKLACGFLANNCDASTALFWDGIHPTAYAHSVLASAMLTAVPEPSSMLMLAVGIGALLAWRRRA